MPKPFHPLYPVVVALEYCGAELKASGRKLLEIQGQPAAQAELIAQQTIYLDIVKGVLEGYAEMLPTEEVQS